MSKKAKVKKTVKKKPAKKTNKKVEKKQVKEKSVEQTTETEVQKADKAKEPKVDIHKAMQEKKLAKKQTNKVWCVHRDILFRQGKWDGLKTSASLQISLIKSKGEFKPRKKLETDPRYKQIIPQIMVRHQDPIKGDTYLLHKITKQGNEERLHDLWPVFVGGHVEEIDADGPDMLDQALMREFDEELQVNGIILNKSFIGIIYIEDDNPVNEVHIGLVYIMDVDTQDVVSNDEALSDLAFVPLEFLEERIDQLTPWSKVMVDYLGTV